MIQLVLKLLKCIFAGRFGVALFVNQTCRRIDGRMVDYTCVMTGKGHLTDSHSMNKAGVKKNRQQLMMLKWMCLYTKGLFDVMLSTTSFRNKEENQKNCIAGFFHWSMIFNNNNNFAAFFRYDLLSAHLPEASIKPSPVMDPVWYTPRSVYVTPFASGPQHTHVVQYTGILMSGIGR